MAGKTSNTGNNHVHAGSDTKERNSIGIISQAFYGNRTYTEIDIEDMDLFIHGYLDRNCASEEGRDSSGRTVVKVPGSEDIVLIYDQNQEHRVLQGMEKEKEDGYERRPLAEIPELDLTLYSRCIVCRLEKDGSFASIRQEDCSRFMQYLAR